jgi:hypothetical protein
MEKTHHNHFIFEDDNYSIESHFGNLVFELLNGRTLCYIFFYSNEIQPYCVNIQNLFMQPTKS